MKCAADVFTQKNFSKDIFNYEICVGYEQTKMQGGSMLNEKRKKQEKTTFDRKTREENKMMWALSQQRVQVIECSDYQG